MDRFFELMSNVHDNRVYIRVRPLLACWKLEEVYRWLNNLGNVTNFFSNFPSVHPWNISFFDFEFQTDFAQRLHLKLSL